MSKAVKELLMRDYESLLEGVDEALVVSVRGIASGPTNRLRLGLAKKNIKITVVRNSLARKALANTKLAALSELFVGPSALAYGAESVVDVARELVEWAKKTENLELKGAILDGEVFAGKAGVEALSKYPTREEAIGKVVTLVLSPAGKLVSQIKGPGSRIVGVLKTIEERLEKGEAIAKVG